MEKQPAATTASDNERHEHEDAPAAAEHNEAAVEQQGPLQASEARVSALERVAAKDQPLIAGLHYVFLK